MPQEVIVPPLGQTTDTVILATWYRKVGDAVTQGEPLFAIETDKATLDIESQTSGILADTSAQVGDVVSVLSSIGTITLAGEQHIRPEGKITIAEGTVASDDHVVQVRPAKTVGYPRLPGERVFISPRAKRLAESFGLAWSALAGTGPQGAIVERDVRHAFALIHTQGVSSAQPSLAIADQSIDYQAQPNYPGTVISNVENYSADVDVTSLNTLVERLAKRGFKVTLAGLIVYISIRVMNDQSGFKPMSIGVLGKSERTFGFNIISDARTCSLVTLSSEIGSVKQVVTASGADTPIRLPALIFADLDQYNIDLTNGLNDLNVELILALGRARNHRDGSRTMWITLSHRSALLHAEGALRYLGEVVRRCEDIDLLI